LRGKIGAEKDSERRERRGHPGTESIHGRRR
jgi:hypothetical protein